MLHETNRSYWEVVSPDHLQHKLQLAGIDTSTWGTGKTKSIQDLYTEIKEHESVLVQDGAEFYRELSVAAIQVVFADQQGNRFILVETEQVWHDGSGRRRSRELEQSLSEKLIAGEDPLTGAMRAVREELGVPVSQDLLVAQQPYVVQAGANSYPGLQSRYAVFPYTVAVPSEHFHPEGYVEHGTEKDTSFQWKSIEREQ